VPDLDGSILVESQDANAFIVAISMPLDVETRRRGGGWSRHNRPFRDSGSIDPAQRSDPNTNVSRAAGRLRRLSFWELFLDPHVKSAHRSQICSQDSCETKVSRVIVRGVAS
jgi:hypothetical protein